MSNQKRVREVDSETLAEWLYEGTARVVDVREFDEYMGQHITGAENMPLSSFDAAALPQGDGRTVVLQCNSGARSAEAARRLLHSGDDEVWHLPGGLQAWKRAGLPIERRAHVPISIMRQVQITAGTLIVAGSLLGALVSPWWLALAGGVGGGLVFAGISGTCGLAGVLRRAPWNRTFECGTPSTSAGHDR